MNQLKYQPSGLNTCFHVTLETPFHEYIETTRKIVAETRVDLNDKNRSIVVNANTPFELLPENQQGDVRNGILLIHGLQDSPYQMKDLAAYFCKRGFLVRTLLLPGHGTVPGDMLDVSYKEWIKAVEYGVYRLSEKVDNLFLGGFSTGGELALLMSLKGYDIKGLFLFAPVTKIKTKYAWVSTTFAAPDWLVKHKEKDYARYESLTSNAVAQVYRLTMEVDRLLKTVKQVSVPTFMALSEDDITVSSENTIHLFNTRLSSEKNRMIVYTSEPEKYQPDSSGKIIYRDSRIPEERIVSFSHLSILVSPDDPHYGKKSDYIYPSHPWLKQSREGISKSQVFFGELMGKFKKEHYIQRLTYNPFFREMTVMMDRYVEDVLR